MTDQELHDILEEAKNALDAWFNAHHRIQVRFGVFYTCNKYRIRTVRVDESCVNFAVYLLDRSIQEKDIVREEDTVYFKYQISTKNIAKL